MVVGLEVGADDYVSKPYRLRELVARIRATLRRAPPPDQGVPATVVEVGHVRLDSERHEVFVRNNAVKLPLKEFELLAALLTNAGRVLTRDALIDRVWGPAYVGDTKTLDVHIKRLRAKVEADPASPVSIVTIRGLGYKFEPPRRTGRHRPTLEGVTKVVADITMSLDGFVTGPGAGLERGLGIGGEPLHNWVFQPDDVDTEVLREATDMSGAVVMGRRLFDIVEGPGGWNDEMGYGAGLAATPPFFVVTHSPPAQVRLGLRFTFVTGGVAPAVEQARPAAGDKAVVVMGGGDVIRQCLDAGLVDELRIHLAPMVLGAGSPLFAGAGRHEMVQRSVRVSANATHLVYDVARSS